MSPRRTHGERAVPGSLPTEDLGDGVAGSVRLAVRDVGRSGLGVPFDAPLKTLASVVLLP